MDNRTIIIEKHYHLGDGKKFTKEMFLGHKLKKEQGLDIIDCLIKKRQDIDDIILEVKSRII